MSSKQQLKNSKDYRKGSKYDDDDHHKDAKHHKNKAHHKKKHHAKGYHNEEKYYGGMYYGGDEGFGYEFHDRSLDKIPPVQFGETTEHWIARIELPGVSRDNVEIRVKKNKVIVYAKQSKTLFFEDIVKDPKSVKWVKRERMANKFKRKLYLPAKVDEKNVHAKLNDGLLEVLINRPQKMRIHAKGGELTTDFSEHHTKRMDLTGSSHMTHDSKTCTIEGCSHCKHPVHSQAPIVIEHVHDKQVHERHIPRVHAVERHEEVHKFVDPIERVEVHKHVHPHERLEVVEHVHPRERIDIHEHVRPIITTEVHEHYHPEITREVHKDIYPPEIKKVAHRDVDLGEVERKVVEKDLGRIDLGKEKIVETIVEKESTHHHHSGEHDKHHDKDKHALHVSGGHEHKEKVKVVEKQEHHDGGGLHTGVGATKVTEKHTVERLGPHDVGETERKIVDKDLTHRKDTKVTETIVTTEKDRHHTGGDHVVGGHHVDVVGNRPGDFEYKKEGVTGSKDKGVKGDKDSDKEKEKERMEHLKKKDDTRHEKVGTS